MNITNQGLVMFLIFMCDLFTGISQSEHVILEKKGIRFLKIN
jgi:hypothetical protein